VGLLPDLAAMRDKAPGRARKIVFGIFALGWRGSMRHYRHYRVVYGLLAGLATPLVLSVHSVVSSDFATGIVPGWHSTIFPPFFVAGAIFSGFAMVITLLVPTRRIFRLENVITKKHLDALGKMTLVTAWIVIYSYVVEDFIAWYGGSEDELRQFFHTRPFGPNAEVFWVQQFCNIVAPQVLWSKRVRTSPVALFAVSILVNIGMWSERFVIIVHGLEQDYLPSSWRGYAPTWVDWSIFVGTGSLFLFLFMLFLRFVPFVPVSEAKELAHELAEEER
jgi:molybdopterin-containing oxidoreductase family membrane subunit